MHSGNSRDPHKTCDSCKQEFHLARNPYIISCCFKQVCNVCAKHLISRYKDQPCPYCNFNKMKIKQNLELFRNIAFDQLNEMNKILEENHKINFSISKNNLNSLLDFYVSKPTGPDLGDVRKFFSRETQRTRAKI